MAEEQTPNEAMDEAIQDLETAAAGEIESISDKVSSGFWVRVKTFFYTLGAALYAAFPNVLTSFFPKAILEIEEVTRDAREMPINEVIDELLDNIDNPRAMLDSLERLNIEYPMMGWILSLVNIMIVFGGVVRAHMDTIMIKASQAMMQDKRPSLIPVETLLEAFFKDPGREYEIKDVFDKLGISDDLQDILKIAATGVLGPEGIQQAFLRGEIDEAKLNELLKAHRLGDESIELLKKLYEVIPPVQDIITMAVREVFSPDVVERFGQMQDFPPDFAAWAKKQGLTEFWAKNYWAAHWSLPSPLQGFEMLHRGVIDQSTLDVLLRALDIMPYWRDKLTQIAFNPLTRVDVRRMYGLGVLDETGVNKAYHDIGYNDENAELMTRFTKAFVSDKERELTKADIIALFKRQALTGSEAAQRLMDLGYTEDNAWLLLLRATYEEEAKMKTKAVSSVRKLYVSGKITEGDVIAKLSGYNMAANEINRYLEVWDLDRLDKVRNLTTKDIERFIAEDIITAEEAMGELRELGYNLQDSQRFIALFTKK